MLVKLPNRKVGGGQAARLVQNVDEHGGAVFGKPLAGDGVFGKRRGEALGSLAKSLFVSQRLALAAFGIHNDGLEALGTHYRANAAAPGMAHGAQFAVGAGDGSRGELEFARTANGDVAAILTVLFHQLGNSIKVVHSGHFGGNQLGVVLAHFELPPFAFLGHVFHNNSQDAQTGQVTAGLTARVGFLDAFGQRAFAAHGNTVGVGAVGGAQQAGSKNKLVVGANGRTGGRHLTRNDGRSQRTAAKASVFLRNFFKNTGLGCHIDAQKTEHGASLNKAHIRPFVFILRYHCEKKKCKRVKKMSRFSPVRGKVGEEKGVFVQ